jgi:hypothetical protein
MLSGAKYYTPPIGFSDVENFVFGNHNQLNFRTKVHVCKAESVRVFKLFADWKHTLKEIYGCLIVLNPNLKGMQPTGSYNPTSFQNRRRVS